jgi:hypothetical protein
MQFLHQLIFQRAIFGCAEWVVAAGSPRPVDGGG